MIKCNKFDNMIKEIDFQYSQGFNHSFLINIALKNVHKGLKGKIEELNDYRHFCRIVGATYFIKNIEQDGQLNMEIIVKNFPGIQIANDGSQTLLNNLMSFANTNNIKIEIEIENY